MTSDLQGYDAAREGATFFLYPDGGYLRVGDADRLDFLQRQTTNDVQLLSPKRGVRTVLTSPTARILDVLWLVDEGEAIGVMTLPGRGARTARYFRGRIFFMDRVTVTDAGEEIVQVDLDGPEARAVLHYLGCTEVPGQDEVVGLTVGGVEVRAVGCQGLVGEGYRLLIPASGVETVRAALVRAGAIALSPDAREVLRVEAGMPGPTGELTEEYTPLEVNLADIISETKGCYMGQEVIARQITYDKVTRRLVGIRLNTPVTVGARVVVEGRPVGAVTSAAISPCLGPVALTVIRRPYDEAGIQVKVITDGEGVPGTVSPLPFELEG